MKINFQQEVTTKNNVFTGPASKYIPFYVAIVFYRVAPFRKTNDDENSAHQAINPCKG